jgi:hypothetical protein
MEANESMSYIGIAEPALEQNNWTLQVSKERTIRTQMNMDEHGVKRKFVSPSARKDHSKQASTYV